MSTIVNGHLRTATAQDCGALVGLWEVLFGAAATATDEPWRHHAAGWFTRLVDDPANARFPVIEVDGTIVATAIGTLQCDPSATGRTVRLMNVITVAEHRGHGFATTLVLDVLSWARSVAADRVDLSVTSEGLPLYAKLGFTMTSARRMNLVL